MEINKMKNKVNQILLIAIVGLFGVLSVNAQQMNLDGYKIVGNTLENGKSLKQGEGIRSPKNTYAAVLQKDGNFCLYKLDSKNINRGDFVQCTMTVGSDDKKGAVLNMQTDGNLALYNSKSKHLWSTDTYRGGNDKQGGRLIMYDDGNLVLVSKTEKAIWNFKKGRLY
jgi:hypothetical protein